MAKIDVATPVVRGGDNQVIHLKIAALVAGERRQTTLHELAFLDQLNRAKSVVEG
jgi:hypothetical protein